MVRDKGNYFLLIWGLWFRSNKYINNYITYKKERLILINNIHICEITKNFLISLRHKFRLDGKEKIFLYKDSSDVFTVSKQSNIHNEVSQKQQIILVKK